MENTYKISGLKAATQETAGEGAKKVLDQYLQKYGMIANMTANMANHNGIIQTYSMGYELLFAEGDLSAAECELLLLLFSRENNCTYCVAAHSMSGKLVSNIPDNVIEAIRNKTEIPDAKLRAFVDFALVMFHTRGNPSQTDAKKFLDAGYSEKNMMSIVLAIAIKTISNYTNHLFHTPNDAMFAPFEWSSSSN